MAGSGCIEPCAAGGPRDPDQQGEMADELLTKAVIEGDRDAISALLQRHGPEVRAKLAGRIASAYQSVLSADDVMQVTYLEAFLRIGSFELHESASFVPWLARIAENNLRDAIRGLEADKRPNPRRQVCGDGDESAVALLDMLSGSVSTPSAQFVRNEAISILRSAVRELPADYRLVVERYDLADESIADVSRALGRSEGAVYMLRARAHDRLRELLEIDSRS